MKWAIKFTFPIVGFQLILQSQVMYCPSKLLFTIKQTNLKISKYLNFSGIGD